MTSGIAIRLIAIGLVVGAVSGFFGIGGGFLIVPGLMLATGMPILNAIGSSLFSVGSFAQTTATNYALSSLVEWAIALLFITGGVAGGYLGMRAAVSLAATDAASPLYLPGSFSLSRPTCSCRWNSSLAVNLMIYAPVAVVWGRGRDLGRGVPRRAAESMRLTLITPPRNKCSRAPGLGLRPTFQMGSP